MMIGSVASVASRDVRGPHRTSSPCETPVKANMNTSVSALPI
jgi:hypothetical protein